MLECPRPLVSSRLVVIYLPLQVMENKSVTINYDGVFSLRIGPMTRLAVHSNLLDQGLNTHPVQTCHHAWFSFLSAEMTVALLKPSLCYTSLGILCLFTT